MPGETKTSMSKKPQLPSVSILISESWDIYKKCFVKMFLVNLGEVLLGIGITLLIAIVSGILLALTGLINNSTISMLIILLPVYLWYFFLCILIETQDFLIIDTSGKMSFSELIRKSLKIFFPFIIILLFTFYFVTGGYFLLIIPGILFAYYFSFASFEVVLDNQKPIAALKRSMFYIQKQFWPILIRTSVIFLLVLISYIPYLASIGISEEKYVTFFAILQAVLGILLSLFTIVFEVTLYKHVKSLYTTLEEKSIRWITITSALGWVVAILILVVNVLIFKSSYNLKVSDLESKITIDLPKENETLCFNQLYKIKWSSPEKLRDVTFIIYHEGSQNGSTSIDFLQGAAGSNAATDEARNEFPWFAGQTKSGNTLSIGDKYTIGLNGHPVSNPNKTVNTNSAPFSIVDCSGFKENSSPALIPTDINGKGGSGGGGSDSSSAM